ncbi:MAG: hypothetical protein HFH37_06505 [Lachnospiraceae bacterium]|nr:hypothetical protein [Lachnospiraceae bacterium]
MIIMKKAAAIGNTLFIYLIALLPAMLFTADRNRIFAFMWERLFFNNVYVLLGFILLDGIIVYILDMLFLLMARNGRWTSQELAKTNMMVKLIQIPAYLFLFAVGLLCCVMIFTIGISFALLLLDIFSIGMTGLFASAAFHALRKEQKISGKMQVFYSLASFLFCVDIVIAILGYRRSVSEGQIPQKR